MTGNKPLIEIDLADIREFLAHQGHAVVFGGPGSGKTTGALVKANQEIREGQLQPFQQVLFLSFARSTVGRVAEAAGGIIDRTVRNRLELTTYHSFAWRLIRSHGYLLQRDPLIRLLPPHDAAARLAEVARTLRGDDAQRQKDAECRRLLKKEGLLVFDLFAELAATLLQNCNRLCGIVSRRYPLIFLDEFQDTNRDEYRLVQCLGRDSQIVALADPEQRIYEFRGADPKRIEEFVKEFTPTPFDFARRNHRSRGTDILKFANDLLTQANVGITYENVCVKTFPTRKGSGQHVWMKAEVINAINRVKSSRDNWSVAVLVPTKRLMLAVSEYLAGRQSINGTRRFPPIQHEVGVDAEGPALAGVAIGRLMECSQDSGEEATRSLLEDLCGHIVGRKGGRSASQAESKLIDGVRTYLVEGRIRGKKRQRILADCTCITERVAAMTFTGDPFADWISIRDVIEEAESQEVRCIALDAKYLKFLRRGAQLRVKLAGLWRSYGTYAGATEAVQGAFVQEHFLAKGREPHGVHVMTIHKSKGKEFDEVIIYEGIHADRMVRQPDEDDVLAQARLSLRVAVSRARERVTILTSRQKRCELL